MRLFVAVTVPEAVRRALWRDAAPLRASALPVRWVREDAVHLTIKFLGDQPAGREAEIAAALAPVATRARPFSLSVNGFGAFPDARRPRVLWAGVEPVPPLELLQHDVERSLAELGFEPEARPFHPHLTLGRVKSGARRDAFAGLEELLTRPGVSGEFGVEDLVLMESRLTAAGAEYHSVMTLPLGVE